MCGTVATITRGATVLVTHTRVLRASCGADQAWTPGLEAWTHGHALTYRAEVDTFWGVVVLVGAALLIWLNVKAHDPDAAKRARAEREAQRARLVCPHCGVGGQVSTSRVPRKQGISGGKATAGLLTGGVSLFVVGLSRKQTMTRMRCGNCAMDWDVG